MLDKVASPTSTHYPAPVNNLINDPTPRDQAVYIPSVSPNYAIAAHNKAFSRELPPGVNAGDLNFLDPANPLFKISHVMSSAGQALYQTKPCIIQTRDRRSTIMIGDSGGYQIANGSLKIRNDADRMQILRWLEQNADWAMTLDVPTGPLLNPRKKYEFRSFADCLNTTLDHLEFFQQNRKPGATRFLNVLQGNTTQETDKWYNAVKGFDFEGWAFAGVLRHNFFNLCRRVIQMADEGLLQDRHWIHILGTNELEVGVGLTALQRAINLHINPDLRISFDTSTPFRNIRWRNVYTVPAFSKNGMTMPMVQCPDQRKLVGSSIRFPWPSPLGDRLTLGDICCRKGQNLNSYRDAQSNFYIQHHNLAALCYGINLANRVFDSESFEARHTISPKMGRAVAAIEEIIKSGKMATLQQHRAIFNAVRLVEAIGESEAERNFLDV